MGHLITMTNECVFSIGTTRFDEGYTPSSSSRGTTNFANLARGDDREQNLRNAVTMMNTRVNELLHWDNPRVTATNSNSTSSRWTYISPR